MSYWIYLRDKNGSNVKVENHSEGGTYYLGGINEAEINVTYNYARFFDFRFLHEKTAKETSELLEKTVEAFGTQQDSDYWKPTKGNVGHTLNILLGWAKKNPDAIWIIH